MFKAQSCHNQQIPGHCPGKVRQVYTKHGSPVCGCFRSCHKYGRLFWVRRWPQESNSGFIWRPTKWANKGSLIKTLQHSKAAPPRLLILVWSNTISWTEANRAAQIGETWEPGSEDMKEQRGNQQGERTVEIRRVPLPISLITLSWPYIPLSGSHTTLWVPLGGQYRTVFDDEGHLSLALYPF